MSEIRICSSCNRKAIFRPSPHGDLMLYCGFCGWMEYKDKEREAQFRADVKEMVREGLRLFGG